METASLLQSSPLPRFLDNRFFSSTAQAPQTSSLRLKIALGFKVFCMGVGLLSGIPWYWDGKKGASLLGSDSEALAIALGIGTIYTVGMDGYWIWSRVGAHFGQDRKEARALETERSKAYQFGKTIAATVLGVMACVAPVYAIITTNPSRWQKISFPIVVFIANFAYKYFGFSELIRIVYEYREGKDPEKSADLAMRGEMKAIIDEKVYPAFVKTKSTTLGQNITSADAFLSYIRSMRSNTSAGSSLNLKKAAFVWFFSTIIPVGSTLVDFYLVRDSLQAIGIPGAGAWVLPVFMQLPDAIVSWTATYALFTRIYDSLSATLSRKASKTQDAIALFYPKVSWALMLVFTTLALSAPAPGAYVTHATLMKDTENVGLSWAATAAVIAARFTFSIFTQSENWRSIFASLYNSSSKNNEIMRHHEELLQISDLFKRVNPEHLKEDSSVQQTSSFS